MTSKLDSLRALQAAVKAGTATDFRAILSDDDPPAERAKRCGWSASAHKGNVNSALQVFDALFPGHHWELEENDDLGFMARILVDDWHLADAASPARALLLAILAALVAQEERGA